MSKVIKSPFRASLIFSLLTFLQPGINFLLLPIYLRYLSPAEYGVYALMVSFSTLTATLAALRIQDAMIPLFFHYHHNPERLEHFLANLLQATLLLNLLFLAAALLLGPLLFPLLFQNEQTLSFYPFGLLAVLIGILNTISAPYTIFLKNGKRIQRYALLHIALVAANVIAQLSLIVGLQRGELGALEARLAGPALLAILVLYLNRKLLWRPLKAYYLRRAFRFSLPMVPYSVVLWSTAFFDRLLFERTFTLDMLGTYSFLLTLTTLVTMASHAFFNGVQPYLFEELSHKEGARPAKVKGLAGLYFSGPFLAAAFILLIAGHLHWLTDRSGYLAVREYISWGVLVFLLESIALFFRGLLIQALQPRALSIVSTAGALLLFGLYAWLIPRLGIWGALGAAVVYQLILVLGFGLWKRSTKQDRKEFMAILMLPLSLIGLLLLPELLYQWGPLGNMSRAWAQFALLSLPILWQQRDNLAKLWPR